MKAIKVLAIMVVMLGILSACKKKNDIKQIIPTIPTPHYLPLNVGNYWIYRRTNSDLSGNTDTSAGVAYDSCYVEKDTLIQGKTYAKYWHANAVGMMSMLTLRDSSSYIIDEQGQVHFSPVLSSADIQSYYRQDSPPDTLCKITTRLVAQSTPITVPAGAYTAYDLQTMYTFAPYTPTTWDPRVFHALYVDSIGIVYESQIGYLNSSEYAESRLVRYHIN